MSAAVLEAVGDGAVTDARPPVGAAARPIDPLVDLFCRELGHLLAERVDAAEVDARGALPAGLLEELGALGAFGVSIPERWGGSELGLGGACAVVDALARRDRAVATTVGLHLGLGTRGLVAFASDAQRERWLPDLASGERLAAFATTEPGAGSDLSRLATRARRRDGSDRVVVDGQKIYVTNGGLADVFTLAVTTEGLGDGRRGQSLIVVERGDAGLAVGPEEHKLGLRGSSTTPVYLDGVEVGVDRIIGEPGAGARHIGQVLAWGRTAMAAGCNGTAAAALDLAAAHALARRQFGKPLAEQPVVRLQLADMAATLFAMRAMVTATAAAEGDELELERRSLAAKVFCSEGDWRICDAGVQLHGGSGYIEETGAALLLRDARVTRIFEGANDVLLSRMGSLELARPGVHGAGALGGAPADGLVDIVDLASEVRATWLEAYGLKLLRDPVRLHRLGRLAALREVAMATAACGGAAADAVTRALRDHALRRLWQEADATARADEPAETAGIICGALCEAVSA